jgi:predicted porin
MNKKLVALAVAGALGAPLAAQAQTANVTMYGSIRAGLISTKADGASRVNSIDNNSSRWGVRGTESLGGGLNALFQYEAGITTDNVGGQTLSTREAWVGLNGGFGEVKLGAGLTPYDDVMGLNHNSYIGQLNNINAVYFGNGFVNYNVCTGTAFDARYGNSLSYSSPKLGPVTVRTQYAFLNETSVGRKCNGWDTALIGGFGPITAGLAYSKHNNFNGQAPSATNGGAIPHDADNWILTVKGSFGLIDANAGLEESKYKGDNGLIGSAKLRGIVVGVGANFGPTKVGVDYTQRNNGIGTVKSAAGAITALASNTKGGGKLATLYVNHALSKRTTGYFWIAQDKPEAGSKTNQIAVSLKHNF